MTDQTPHHDPLSGAGRARREAMLPDLLGRMNTVHARRRLARRAGSVLTIVALSTATLFIAMNPLSRLPPPAPAGRGTTVPAPIAGAMSGPDLVFEVVATDPDAAARHTVRTRASFGFLEDCSLDASVAIVSDECLLESLSAMNRPAGLIRIGSEVRLSRPVINMPLSPAL